MTYVDASQRQKVMNSKIESKYSNQVLELVDLLEGVKDIGCKWDPKEKENS